MPPVLLYIHGFNSSPSSMKAQVLKSWLAEHRPDIECLIPELHHLPQQAIFQLTELLSAYKARDVLLIGSSLGGYYSTWLIECFANRDNHPNLKAVLVNPAVYPYRLLAEWLGENTNMYTHDKYELTQTHLEQLIQLDCAQLKDPNKYLLMTQTADETLDYREAVVKFSASPQIVQEGGCHGFSDFETMIPTIIDFAYGELPSSICEQHHA